MPDTGLVEWTLRRDRAVVASVLAAVTALAWIYILAGAGMSMSPEGAMPPMAEGAMPSMAEAPMPPAWTAGHAALMIVMWAAMMIAMMLPSAAPTILLFATLARKGQAGTDPGRGTAAFTWGYVVVWLGFSLAAVVLQWALARAALLSPMVATTSAAVAGSVLIGAGLYQFTPLKQACLRRCRSPLDFLSTYWQQGPFRMGLGHGLFCLGCCWALMLLLFVGGVMNLLWIGALALFVLVEKLAPAGASVGRVAGALLIAWGGATLVSLG